LVSQPTNLYAKVFIDGFSKPSYVVFTIHLNAVIAADVVRRAALTLVERHPLLRSKVERSWLGVPVRFRHFSPSAWLSEGSLHIEDGFDFSRLHAFEEELLSTPLDPVARFPFQGWLLNGEIDGRPASTIVAKAHHAIVDASSGKILMLSFAEACREALGGAARPAPSPAARPTAPAEGELTPLKRASQWLKAAELAPRVPAVSVLADFKPSAPTPELRVSFRERAVPVAELDRIRDRAAAARLTSSQLLCAALFRAMHAYNRAEVERRPGVALPGALGLMIAVSRRWAARGATHTQKVGFEADTRLLRVPAPILDAPAREPELFAIVREGLGLRRGGHNDVALGLLYASRWVESRIARVRGVGPKVPEPVSEIHLTLSDLTGGATRLPRAMDLTPDLRVESVRYLVSPVAPAHGGLIVSVSGAEVRFTLLYHEGALRADALLDALFEELSMEPHKGRENG
jgi:hypothetical protein